MWRMPDYSNQVQLTRCFLKASSEQKLSVHVCWGGRVSAPESAFFFRASLFSQQHAWLLSWMTAQPPFLNL